MKLMWKKREEHRLLYALYNNIFLNLFVLIYHKYIHLCIYPKSI